MSLFKSKNSLQTLIGSCFLNREDIIGQRTYDKDDHLSEGRVVVSKDLYRSFGDEKPVWNG